MIGDEGKPGERIGAGGTAEVFAWGSGHVLKLYRPGATLEQVEREASQTRAVRRAGVLVPEVMDIVRVQGRPGIVFERVIGPTLLEVLGRQPAEAAVWARAAAELHARLHTLRAPELPSLREVVDHEISRAHTLPEDLRGQLRTILATMPEHDVICHGDFHPINVLVTRAGLVTIDWFNATRGNRLADLARTQLLLRHTPVPRDTDPGTREVVESVRRGFADAYRAEYATRMPADDPTELATWTRLVAAARLAREISPGERAFLQSIVQSV